jgi:hypothetical protein
MVVNDFDGERVAVVPAEADPPLGVDPDAVLTEAISTQGLETIPGRHSKIGQRFRSMQHQKPSTPYSLDPGESRNPVVREQLLRLATPKLPYHAAWGLGNDRRSMSCES